MSSESFINISKMKSLFTNFVTPGGSESKIDIATGQTLLTGDPPPTARSRSINVVLFGETGVGKSSVINLIARKEVAKVSSDVNGCTMQSTRYDIPFDNMNFVIFDTIGLEEPQMGVNGYLKAIEKAYELIVKLGAAGGIHLLLFCMRGGRITATTQSNYRLFCECLCNAKVPIALVFTGLEREVEMEDWWTRNKTYIEQYGIKSDGHACVTAVQDDTPGEDLKYMESQTIIRELLKTCALKNEAFAPEPHSWFGRLGKGMRSFIEKHRNPRKKDVMKVLTRRCKLDLETARKIVDMMEKGDTEAKGENMEQAGEGEVGPNIAVKADDKEASKENVTEDDALQSQPDEVKAEPRTDATRNNGTNAKEQREIVKRNMARGHALLNQLGNTKAEARADGTERRDDEEVARSYTLRRDALPSQRGSFEAEPRIDRGRENRQYKHRDDEQQLPGPFTTEQTRQGDAKAKLFPPVPPRSRPIRVGSQS